MRERRAAALSPSVRFADAPVRVKVALQGSSAQLCCQRGGTEPSENSVATSPRIAEQTRQGRPRARLSRPIPPTHRRGPSRGGRPDRHVPRGVERQPRLGGAAREPSGRRTACVWGRFPTLTAHSSPPRPIPLPYPAAVDVCPSHRRGPSRGGRPGPVCEPHAIGPGFRALTHVVHRRHGPTPPHGGRSPARLRRDKLRHPSERDRALRGLITDSISSTSRARARAVDEMLPARQAARAESAETRPPCVYRVVRARPAAYTYVP